MFDLVADVEKYPAFLPMCRAVRIISRGASSDRMPFVVATMTVGFGPVSESFTTRSELDRTGLQISTALVEGPFHKLENRWKFSRETQGTGIQFSVDYDFRSRLLQMLMGSMFDEAFKAFGHAFEHRADELFGRPTGPVDVPSLLKPNFKRFR